MLFLVLGGLALFIFWGGLRAFEHASVTSIKSLIAWIAALGGLCLVLLLVLSGRWPLALGALTFFGPTLWNRWRAAHPAAPGAKRPGSGAAARRSGTMTREEAYQVLGVHPGASEDDIRAAHRRLMQGAHPDRGGSDWLASRINQARDVLLGG
jgi:DnaJ homolog subfamily C member 19